MWTFLTGAGLVVGLWLIVSALRRRKWKHAARRRRRCPKCGYSMEGIEGLRCPECGRTARRERDLLRARVSRRRLAMGVAVIGAGLAVQWVRGRLPHAWSYDLPTPILATIFRWEWVREVGPIRDPLIGTLGSRMYGADAATQERVARAAIRGDSDARLWSDEWSERYERLLERCFTLPGSGAFTDVAATILDDFAEGAPPSLWTRKRWPVGVPLVAFTGPSARLYWLDYDAESATVAPTDRPVRVVDAMTEWPDVPEHAESAARWAENALGTAAFHAPLGKSELTLDVVGVVSIDEDMGRWTSRARAARSEARHTHQIRLTVEGVATIDDAIAPVRSPAVEEALRDRVVSGVTFEEGRASIGLRWPVEAAWEEALTMAVRIEIVHGEQVLAETFRFGRARRAVEDEPVLSEWTPDLSGEHAIEEMASWDPTRWKLRIRSKPELALYDLLSERYWHGTVEIPLVPDW